MDYLIGIIEFLAILTFAYTGLVEARKKDMDFVGACTLALVTAFGGGTVRDVLLNRRPLYWVEHYEYTIIIFILSRIFLWLFRSNRGFFSDKLINTIDALGLGLFSASGVAIALENKIPVFPASLIGVITAVAGGVIRDVFCNEIPSIFQRVRLYVTCAFVGICGLHLARLFRLFVARLSRFLHVGRLLSANGGSQIRCSASFVESSISLPLFFACSDTFKLVK